MTDIVRSLGGPLIAMEMRLWPKWGGVDSNSATKGETNDYEFTFRVNSYIGLINIEDMCFLVFDDLPTDAIVRYNYYDDTLDIIRLMNGDFGDPISMMLDYSRCSGNNMRFIPTESMDKLSFQSSQMVLADATYTKARAEDDFIKSGYRECVEFSLPSLTCSILTYEYEPPDCLLIIHQIKGL